MGELMIGSGEGRSGHKAAKAARASLLTNSTLIATRNSVLRLTPTFLAAGPALAYQRWTAPTIKS